MMYFTLIILDNNVETMCFRVPLNPNSPMLDVKKVNYRIPEGNDYYSDTLTTVEVVNTDGDLLRSVLLTNSQLLGWRAWVHEMSHFAKEVEAGKYLLNVNGKEFDFTEYHPEFILHNWTVDDDGESVLKVAVGKARHGEMQFNLKGKEAETFRQLLGEYKLAVENTDNFTFKFYSVKP
jgi:hypothetical protein